MPKKKPDNPPSLREGEYPVTHYATTPDGIVQEIVSSERVPAAERPVAPIHETLLTDFLLPTFDSLNIKGKTGIDAIILLAKMGAHKYDSLRKFITAWQDLHHPAIFKELFPELKQTTPTLEQACSIADIPHDDLIADLTKMIYHYGLEGVKWQLQTYLPEVMRASYDVATQEGAKGYQDRQLLAKAAGLVIDGPGVVVNNNNNLTSNTAIVGLPKWEDSDRVLQKTLNAPRQLAEKAAVDAEIIEEKEGDALGRSELTPQPRSSETT